jgi:hypothetical protein
VRLASATRSQFPTSSLIGGLGVRTTAINTGMSRPSAVTYAPSCHTFASAVLVTVKTGGNAATSAYDSVQSAMDLTADHRGPKPKQTLQTTILTPWSALVRVPTHCSLNTTATAHAAGKPASTTAVLRSTPASGATPNPSPAGSCTATPGWFITQHRR